MTTVTYSGPKGVGVGPTIDAAIANAHLPNVPAEEQSEPRTGEDVPKESGDGEGPTKRAEGPVTGKIASARLTSLLEGDIVFNSGPSDEEPEAPRPGEEIARPGQLPQKLTPWILVPPAVDEVPVQNVDAGFLDGEIFGYGVDDIAYGALYVGGAVVVVGVGYFMATGALASGPVGWTIIGGGFVVAST